MPKDVMEKRKAAERKEKGKKETQTTLDGVVRKVQVPTSFTPEGILKHTMELIVCGAHVSQGSIWTLQSG